MITNAKASAALRMAQEFIKDKAPVPAKMSDPNSIGARQRVALRAAEENNDGH